jgi:hypothetical protein
MMNMCVVKECNDYMSFFNMLYSLKEDFDENENFVMYYLYREMGEDLFFIIIIGYYCC